MKKKTICTLMLASILTSLFSGINVNAAEAPVHRLLNVRTGEHLYTADTNETNFLRSQSTWNYEGVAFYNSASGDQVYRVYNPKSGEHHYTKDNNEISTLLYSGWRNEGLAFTISRSADSTYRLYNPSNPAVAQHHYTADANERKALLATGKWRDEGVAWGISTSTPSAPVVTPIVPVTTPTPENPSVNANINPNAPQQASKPEVNGSTSQQASKPEANASQQASTANREIIDFDDLTSSEVDRFVKYFVNELNAGRAAYTYANLTPLTLDSDMTMLANIRAEEVGTIKFSHNRDEYVPGATEHYIINEPQYSSIKNRFNPKDGQIGRGENLFVARDFHELVTATHTRDDIIHEWAHKLYQGWYDSAGHYARMMDPDVTHVGLGTYYNTDYAQAYFAMEVAGELMW